MALRRIILGSALLVALSSVSGVATAGMLDEPACNALKNEQARLAADGLKTEMLHGPDWAKANLPASRLQEIKHLMEIEEKINFRCPLPPPPKAAEPAAATADDAAAPTKSVKKKKQKKKPDEAVPTDATVESPPASTAEQTPPPKKKKKAKKQPANDAYVAPAPTGNAFMDGEAEPVPQPPAAGTSKPLSP